MGFALVTIGTAKLWSDSVHPAALNSIFDDEGTDRLLLILDCSESMDLRDAVGRSSPKSYALVFLRIMFRWPLAKERRRLRKLISPSSPAAPIIAVDEGSGTGTIWKDGPGPAKAISLPVPRKPPAVPASE